VRVLTGSQSVAFLAPGLCCPWGGLAGFQWKPMYALRYLVPFLPAYLLLIACGASAIRRPWLRWTMSPLSWRPRSRLMVKRTRAAES